MACPNFKKGLKMAFGPLGVKSISVLNALRLGVWVFIQLKLKIHYFA
jgi:hypothetical protein